MQDVSPTRATNFVAWAGGQGTWNCFLACKTLERDAAGATKGRGEPLRLLQTDHFDL